MSEGYATAEGGRRTVLANTAATTFVLVCGTVGTALPRTLPLPPDLIGFNSREGEWLAQPVWVEAEDLWRAMTTTNEASGKMRGFILVNRKPIEAAFKSVPYL